MLSDRELLELAAKAAGIDGVWHEEWRCLVYVGAPPFVGGVIHHTWSPLTDDGDALRLAVKLHLFNGAEFYHFRSLERFGRQDEDDLAATRRAIVRAAAEIAKEQR